MKATSAAFPASLPPCGIVVIGRNEGMRLGPALASAVATGWPVVYVDSRSTDDSVLIAKEAGAEVVELDATAELSAALARNVGAAALCRDHPEVELLQFIDGDCVLEPDWVERARRELAERPDLAAVCGYRREEQPRRNGFHRVAELEWHMGPVGEVNDFAGDVMMRRSWFERVGGYDPVVMAGEDTEMSSRLRAVGARLMRIDAVSTTHDIAMSTLRQWWRRAERGGYGAALVAHRHWRTDRLFWPQTRRAVLWGVVAPALAVAALRWTRLPLVVVGARFALSVALAARGVRHAEATLRDRLAWGLSCASSLVAGAFGALRYGREALLGRHPHLIEYK